MSYIVFARKYRPQSFDEVIGQTSSVTTLQNAISLNRVHQAYLFCGARGVGKTSLARILAKSLNCEKGPALKPCQTCGACVEITTGKSMDVQEIDGASNTSVDDVRELREQVKYLPTRGKYKIIIIDEVHMLSTSAFNALLKTLEEPPAHVIFVFATTEPHKIPVTILSRCQRFDFKRLPQPLLVTHLKNILDQEKLSLPDESLQLIARCGDGSVRDSLSLLDQIVSYCGDKASEAAVREALGLSDTLSLQTMTQAILEGNTDQVLAQSQGLFEHGADLALFCEGLVEMLHRLILTAEGGEKYLSLTDSEVAFLKTLTQKTNPSRLHTLFQILSRGAEEVSRSETPRLSFEVLLLRLIRSAEFFSIPEILEALKSDKFPAPSPAGAGSPSPAPVIPQRDRFTAPAPTTAPANNVNKNTGDWTGFVRFVLEKKPQLGGILEHAFPLGVTAEKVLIGFAKKNGLYAEMLKDRMEQINEFTLTFFGKKIPVEIKLVDEPQGATVFETKEKAEISRQEEVKGRALSHPAVKMAQEMLGAKVREVKEIK